MSDFKYFIYAYSPASESAKLLAEKLEAKRIKHTNSKFRGGFNKAVVIWGASAIDSDATERQISACTVVNNTELCRTFSDKSSMFRFFNFYDIPSVEATNKKDVAADWIMGGNKVVIRNIVKGSGGAGIDIVNNLNDLYSAPLYTKYFPKKKEFRVHISNRSVFYTQRKVIRKSYLEEVGPENVNWQIRNSENGFIFQRYNIEVPDAVKEVAEILRDRIKLFLTRRFIVCADVLYNERMDTAVVCEVNTAPGLDNTSAEIYAEEIRNIVEVTER